eukprot:scaffold28770_cov64-Phaeocystis_antarctica.AAC.11
MFAGRMWPATRAALVAAAAAARRRIRVPRPPAPPEPDRPGRHMTDRPMSTHVAAHVAARAPPRGNSGRRTHEAHAAARGRGGQGGRQHHAHRKRRLTLGDHHDHQRHDHDQLLDDDRDPHAGDRVRGPVHVHAPHPGRPHTAREAAMAGIAPARDFGKFPAATRVLRRTVPGRTRARITVSRERTHWGHVNGPG